MFGSRGTIMTELRNFCHIAKKGQFFNNFLPKFFRSEKLEDVANKKKEHLGFENYRFSRKNITFTFRDTP